MERTDAVAILPVGADEARHGDNAAVGKQLGHFTDAADVLLAIGRRKAEVFVEAVANIVPVEHVGQPAALDEGVFECEGNGAFARAAQASEPECRSLLVQQLAALRPGNTACGASQRVRLPARSVTSMRT